MKQWKEYLYVRREDMESSPTVFVANIGRIPIVGATIGRPFI